MDNNDLLVDFSGVERYSDAINNPPISTIREHMPKDLSKLERAYYIYIELGKIINENPKFVYDYSDVDMDESYDSILLDGNNYGVCKTISELYVAILREENIDADLTRKKPNDKFSHVDVILKIDNENYLANLVADLSRIKTSRIVRYFGERINPKEIGFKDKAKKIIRGFKVYKDRFVAKLHNDEITTEEKIFDLKNIRYFNRLKKHYGTISSISEEKLEQMDHKCGYNIHSYYRNGYVTRKIYTKELMGVLKKNLTDPKLLKEYVFQWQNVPQEKILEKKLDYIFQYINQMTAYTGDLKYMELRGFLTGVLDRVLTDKEIKRLDFIDLAKHTKDNNPNLTSVLRIRPSNKNEQPVYYTLTEDSKNYVKRTKEELNQIMKDRGLSLVVGKKHGVGIGKTQKVKISDEMDI